MVSDIRYALRSLRRTPGFTFVVLATLAIGIGVGAGLFLKSFSALIAQEPGIDTAELLTGNVILNGPRYADVSVRTRFWDDVEAALGAGGWGLGADK